MKYYIGVAEDNGALVIGHEVHFFGTCTRISIKNGKKECSISRTVLPESLHLIEGEIARVCGMGTESGLVIQSVEGL